MFRKKAEPRESRSSAFCKWKEWASEMIRKATKSDLDAVSEIYAQIHDWEQSGRLSIGWLPGVYPVRATAQAALDRDDLFVYEDSGRVLASAILNREQVDVYAQCHWKYEAADSEILVMHTLTVSPTESKRGIGRQFAAFYEAYARNAGCRVLRLDTNAKNTVARRFYAKLGYSEAGIVPCYFNGIPGVNLVLLEKPIAGTGL